MNWTIALAFTFLVELLLSFTWNRAYFRFGIPVYIRRCELVEGKSSDEIAEYLGATSNYSIRSLSDREVAIRERFGILARGGLMHGIILLNPTDGSMRIVGYLDWVVLLFGIALVFIGTWLTLPFLAVLLALYGVAKLRFDKLCVPSNDRNDKGHPVNQRGQARNKY
jgi:hypothetical protein